MTRLTLTAASNAPAQPQTERPAWKALAAHYQTVRGLHLRKLFAEDPSRGERLSAAAAGLYLDYSKKRIADETMRLLARLKQLSNYCQAAGQLLMFELLVPATKAQMVRVQADKGAYDLRLRPALILDPCGEFPRRATSAPHRRRSAGDC